jgi:pimeloyl-ACP methyl ester carboxylesterase
MEDMRRREFLQMSSGAIAARPLGGYRLMDLPEQIDAGWYSRKRQFASLPMSRVAFVEHGQGPAALFVHGYPLNGFQWRGALERLHLHRRCIAPDAMGLGFTETPAEQIISPETQADVLVALLDSLKIDDVDLVANDSGGMVAQIFVAKYPKRVRTLLLTNCDVDTNNPPPQFLPLVSLARKGVLVDGFIVPQLKDKQLARSMKGIGGLAYSYPDRLSDEAIETYFRPLVATPLKKAQVEQYAIAMGTNALMEIREELHRWKGAARMVWAMKDTFFGVEWAEWLDRMLPGSHGVRRVEQANLFFPEEMPELIADEAKTLWGVS